LPVAVETAAKVICLPIYPNLQAEEQQRVIDIIRTT
jgi:dTDP-4-amino-4,6-dideoxygalactose transaminase